MAILLLIVFLVVPIIELYVIVQVADAAGVLPTLALLVAVSIAGSLLVRREGLSVWGRFRAQLMAGELPTDELVNGFLVLFAGALLLTPGFVTDAVGLALLLPPVRAVVRRLFLARTRRRIESGYAFAAGPTGATWAWVNRSGGGRVHTGDAVIVTHSSERADSAAGHQGTAGGQLERGS